MSQNIGPTLFFVIFLGSGARTEELLTFRGSSQMTLALFWVSYTPWWLCQPVFIFWPTPWWTDLNQKPSFLESRLFPLVLMSVAYNIGYCLYNQPSICHKSGPVEPRVRPLLDGFPWIFHHLSLSFCHLFELLLVVQCCDIICEWPLIQQPWKFATYMIATRIWKIDLEIADVKVGNHHLEIDILLLHRIKIQTLL